MTRWPLHRVSHSRGGRFLPMLMLNADCLFVRIPQIPFHRKIVTKAMQRDVPHARGFAHLRVTRREERNRSFATEEFRRVEQPDLVDDARAEAGPVNHGASFDEHAGDLHAAKATEDLPEIRTTVVR